MKRGSFVRQALSYAIVLAAAAFLYLTIARNWAELREFRWSIDPLLLISSVVLHVGVLAWGVYVWSLVLRMLDAPTVAYRPLLRIWSASNLTKYIPGTVWQFVTAAHLSRGEGLPGVIALTSMILHVGFTLLAALVISAVALPLEGGLGVASSLWVRAAVIAAAVVAIHPGVVNAALRLVPRALHREVLVWRGRWYDGLRLLALALLSWTIYGMAFSLFVASLATIPVSAVIPLTAVNALSFTAGYIAVLAPGGIGVRESAMTLLLAPILPAAVAAVLSIAARLWSVAAELTLAAAGVVLGRRSD